MTEYLRDQILARQLEQPIGIRPHLSRRARDDAAGHVARALDGVAGAAGGGAVASERLVARYGAASARRARRPAGSGRAGALANASGRDPGAAGRATRTRLHALWTLDGIDAIEPATVTRALEDGSRDVRVSAVRIAERWLGEPNHPIHAAVLKRLDDPDWAVRRQLAASLGALPPGPRDAAVVSLLERYADDPIALDAALSGLRGSEAAVLEKLAQSRVSPARPGRK